MQEQTQSAFQRVVPHKAEKSLLIKVALYLVSLAASVPVLGVIYWVFDASYLAAFGVSPEVYSRPAFESNFINLWLSMMSVKPFLWGISVLFFFALIALTLFHFRRATAAKSPLKQNARSSKFIRLIDAIDKAYNFPMALALPILLVLLISLNLIQHYSEKAKGLAEFQVEQYLAHDICLDSFTNIVTGCYQIEGEAGDNHFVILNNQEVVIFMTKAPLDGDLDELNAAAPAVRVTVRNKSSGERLVRSYQVSPIKKDA